MGIMTSVRPYVFIVLLLVLGPQVTVYAQNHAPHHGEQNSSAPDQTTVLQAPGQSAFGAVQEAIRRLEADSTTDWSEVDVDRLRQHLVDMHHVALNVAVEEKSAIEKGLRLRIRPTEKAARASLDRVLEAHPMMLKQETGWTMEVEKNDASYVLRVTSSDASEADKIRALGYMGLLAYGSHHQRHHWHLVQGADPHSRGSE